MFANYKKHGNLKVDWNKPDRTKGAWKNVYKLSPKNVEKLYQMPMGNERIKQVHQQRMPTHQVLTISTKDLKSHISGDKKSNKIEHEMNEYLKNISIPMLVQETNNEETTTWGDYDSDNGFDQEEADRKIKVYGLGSYNNMFRDVYPDGDSGDEMIEHEVFDEKLRGMKLPSGYMVDIRDDDVFIVKEL